MRFIKKVKKRVHTYFILKFEYSENVVDYIRYIPSSVYHSKKDIWSIVYSDLTSTYILKLINNYDFKCKSSLYHEIKNNIAKASKRKTLSHLATSDIELPEFPYNLYEFQKAGIEYMLKTKRCFNADDMGLGKTIQTLCALEAQELYPSLIIVPKICIDLDTWRKEAKKWIPHRSCTYIGDQNHSWGDDIQIINYAMTKELVDRDYFDRAGKKIANFHTKKSVSNVGFKSLVLDESQYVKNSSSKRTKDTKALSKGIEYIFLLSGTPMENRPKEIIPQLQILGKLKQFGGWNYFVNRYCNAKPGYGGAIDYDGASNMLELNEKLRSLCYLRREKEDVIHELPEKYTKEVYLEIDNMDEYEYALNNTEEWIRDEKERNARQKNINYDLFEGLNLIDKNLYDFEEGAIELQIINALRIVTSRGKINKSIEYIKKLLKKGKKIAVSSNRIETQDMLIKEFPNAPVILGNMDASVKKANYEKYQNDEDCNIIICSLKASNFAINLHSGNWNCTMELDWNPEIHNQFEDRQHRIGQKKDVHCVYFIAKNTIDEDIKELLDKKALIVNEGKKGVKNESMFSIKDELIKRIKEKKGVLK